MVAPVDLDLRLQAINQRFKLAGLGLSLERRGDRLGLRGTLPPRPGSGRSRPYQQRISLRLPASPSGLREAERQLKIIAGQILQGNFDWEPWLVWSKESRLTGPELKEALWKFEQQFFRDPQRQLNPAASRTTWETAYAPYLRRLHTVAGRSRQPLADLLRQTIESYPIDSRSRQLACTALSALASFLELALPEPLTRWAGIYGPSRTQRRDLPGDRTILDTFERIPNPTWRWVFGMMATYGLRNHEVFFCDCRALAAGEGEATIRVLEPTKTGEHEVWPFYPDWIERFGLRELQVPPICTDLTQTTLQRIGQRVTRQFRRYDIPFSPYDLRHAWAIRTIHLGLPDAVSAKMMGHSITIHNRTYQKWITRRDQQLAVAMALRGYQPLADLQPEALEPAPTSQPATAN
jgi:integrase